MATNEFDKTKPATSGTDASADLRNNFLSLAQGGDLLNVYASTPNDKKVHWKAANRVYIGGAMLAIASGELNMANFNSYVATDGYWAKALLNINFSGEKDVRIGTQSQWSGETTMPNIPSSEIPIATVNFQRNGSSINNIANTNINDMRPMVMVDAYNATNATNAINTRNIRNVSRNLIVKNNTTNPNYQVDIDADEIILQDSSGVPYRATAVDLTANITVNGVNGLDTGSEAANTFYYIWIIYNGTTVAGLLSTSATSPTMPTGYTYKAGGWGIYNDSNPNFSTIYQQGNKTRSDIPTSLNVTTTALTINVLTVPVTAKIVNFIVRPTWASNFSIFIHPIGTFPYAAYFAATVQSSSLYIQGDCIMDTPQTVYMSVSVAAGNSFDFLITGWEY